MGPALTLLLLLTFSVLVTRIASVALRLTGLPDATARFQALSAFSGTGYTTHEAEAVVNYPVRRRIVTLLMIVGNLGLVAVLATLVVGFVGAAGEQGGAMRQLFWLLGAVGLVWLFLLNPVSDRVLCGALDGLLRRTTELGRRSFQRLLQVDEGWSVCEHPVSHGMSLDPARLAEQRVLLLAVRRADGRIERCPTGSLDAAVGDTVIAYGPDRIHHRWQETATPGSKR